jgi:Lrp/AsnC family leucine-responsive transcriptional regulator
LINRIAQFGFSKTSIVLSTTVDRALPLNHLETNVVKIRADA